MRLKGSDKIARGHKPDYILAAVVFGLLLFGLVMMFSISPVLSYKLLGSTSRNYYFFGQLGNLAVGLVAWAVIYKFHYSKWKQYALPLMFVVVFILIAMLIPGIGVSEKGATRWLRLGPVSFQPAELMKLATIVYLATWFEKRKEAIKTFWDGFLPFALMLAAASFVIVILQRDMGTMLVIIAAAVSLYFVAGARLKHLAVLFAAGAAAGWLAVISFPHRLERITAFLNPDHDPSGLGYHINQALIAIGSGGIFGRGLGKSYQIYGYLPEAANDSIFAVVAEEFGLIGSVLLLGLFVVLIFRGLKIAKAAPDFFSQLVATGIAVWFGSQALINIAAMLSLVPLTGIPMPFVSHGGSSLVVSMVGVGLLLNISRYTNKEAVHAPNSQRRRNGWAYFANSSHNRRAKVAR